MIWRKSFPYAVGQFCIVAFQWAAMLFLPLFFQKRSISAAGIGLLISLFSLATLVLVFPLGVLADRLSPRPLLFVSALVAAAAVILWPLSHSFGMLALATAGAGAAFTLATIALYTLFFKQVGETQRGVEVSIFTIGGILGAGVGACVCGRLSGRFPVELVLCGTALAAAAGWAMITAFLPAVRGIAFPLLEYGEDLRRGRTWILIAIMFITASHSGFEQAGYTLLQTEVIGLSPKNIGDLFLLIAFWMTGITLWTGRRHDRHERPLLMMSIALIVSGIFMAASAAAHGALDFVLYRFLHTFGDAIFQLLILVVAAEIFPRHRVGGAFAFALTINTASCFLFANVGGIIGQKFGFDRAFYLSGAIEVAAGLALLAFRPRLRKAFHLSSS